MSRRSWSRCVGKIRIDIKETGVNMISFVETARNRNNRGPYEGGIETWGSIYHIVCELVVYVVE